MIEPYRILHIITRLIVGGAQENTLYSAELLGNYGNHVDVLVGPQTGPEGSLHKDARRRNISILIERNLVREIHPLKDLIAFFKMVRLIKKGKYAIVHTHSSKAGILGRWAAWVAGCPTIVHTIHGWGFHDYQHRWQRLAYIILERFTLGITDQLIAVSNKDIKKGIASKIGRAADYVLIRSGIDIDEFKNPSKSREEVRNMLGIPHDVPVVGTVTRLSSQKSPLTFVHIAAKVVQQIPDVVFIIVGDGPMREIIELEARALGIADRLILTGLRRDVQDLLQGFDIFLLTSLWEGLPRVIPQAMAAGVPVIASAVDGNAEIIENEENGLLVEPGNIADAADAVIGLMTNTQKKRLLAKRAQQNLDEYSVYSMVRKINGLYTGEK